MCLSERAVCFGKPSAQHLLAPAVPRQSWVPRSQGSPYLKLCSCACPSQGLGVSTPQEESSLYPFLTTKGSHCRVSVCMGSAQ